MKIICASSSCKYSSKNEDSSNIIFISFPNDDTSTVWAHHCGRPDLMMKSNEELHKNYYICADHIEDRYFISKTNQIMIAQGAVPTLFGINNESPQHCHDHPALKQQYSSDHVIETLHLDNCINNVNNTCSSDYVNTEDSTYQNAIYNSDLHDTNNHIDEISRNEEQPVDHTDNNSLNFCSININIDQFDDMTIRFINLCRVCGQGINPSNLDLFTGKGAELKLIEKVHLHLPIFIENEDSMPQKICTDCYEKLEVSHALFITCLRTDIRLRKYLNLPCKYNNEDRFRELITLHELEINNEMCIDASNVEELPISQEKEKHSDAVNDSISDETNKNSNTQDMIVQDHQSVIQCPENNLVTSKIENRFKFVLQSDLNNLILEPLQTMQNDIQNNSVNTSVAQNVDLVINKECRQVISLNNNSDKTQNQCDDTRILNITQNNCQVNCIVSKDIFENDKICEESNRIPCKDSSEKFHCGKCDSKFVNQKELTQHELIHLKEKNPEQQRRCGHCSEPFSNRKSLQTHMAEKHVGQQLLFKCGSCDKIYEKWSSLDVHEATHRQDKPYLCDLCGKSFKHSNNLRGHKRIHLDISKKKRHICEICGNAFRSRFHLKEHMNQHNGNKPYVCEQCGKAFSKRIQLRQHRLSHGSNKYACPICGVTFNRRGNMNTHVKRHSNYDGMYTCSVCEYRCKSMSELKLHRKQHSDSDIAESIKKKCSNKPVWDCKVCSKVFPKRSALLNHERTHDGTQLRVECDKCGKKLSSKSSLKYHIKSVHTFERPHMCQFCGDVFISKEARLIHERIHTGERPYSCELCNMQYRCSSHLSQHMKVHSEIRPYVCGYCNKTFARKGSMTVHERIHTGVKPFVCNVCDKTFIQKYDMIKHTKTHQVKTFRCEDCNESFPTKTDIFEHFENVHKPNSSSTSIDEEEKLPEHMETYSTDVSHSNIEESKTN